MILGFSVTVGLPEIIIFLLAAILLGFSIHFYWSGRRSVPGIPQDAMPDHEMISENDQWRLQYYEQIERHEKTEERLQKELLKTTESEKRLLKELEETRDELARLEHVAEKATVSEVPSTRMADLVMAQQNLHASLTREMTERLEKAYEEFNFLQNTIQKIQSQVVDPQKRNFEIDEVEQSYYRLTKDFDELKLKHLNLMDEHQKIVRILADTEEKLRDANFQKQQLSRKINFLEELANDLQQVSGHNKKLEGQLRRISEIEALLTRGER